MYVEILRSAQYSLRLIGGTKNVKFCSVFLLYQTLFAAFNTGDPTPNTDSTF